MVHNRRRGTAIVEFHDGILVVSQGSESFMLAGGGANKGESRRDTAKRELQEETGLEPLDSTYLFSYKGRLHRNYKGGHFRDYHKVFLIKAEGTPIPQKEIKHIAFFKEGSSLKLTYSTREIIEKFLAMKGEGFKAVSCKKCGGGTFKPSIKIANALECDHCGELYLKS
jgi:8-oxo-dGTP diphosphatase